MRTRENLGARARWCVGLNTIRQEGASFFRRIAIIGVGLIGGSLGLSLKRTGFKGRVVGISRPETIAQALELGVIDEGTSYAELAEGLRDVELVFLCTPIKRIIELLPQVMAEVSAGTLVTDVGSTKRRLGEVAAACGRQDVHFIGGHPMAGSEKAGVMAADPFLFQNAIYILVPGEGVPEDLHAALREMLAQLGAKVLELSAETHDEVVAAISHLPQMIATSLVEMVGRMNEEGGGCFLPLAAGGFRDLTRIASSPFAPVWGDICATNADQIGHMIDRYVDLLKDVRQRLVDPGSLERDFAFANDIRSQIPKDAKGFIHALQEILVVAEDRPGVIAEIATKLADQELNINDIEVLKVREGEGGTIRLGFDSGEAAERSLEVLRGLGYQARRR